MASLQSIKNMHLWVSAIIVMIAALIYGSNPEVVIPYFLDFTPQSLDEKNILRALMGLYFGLAIFWILGTRKPRFWESATLVNILFMGGLIFGRVLSYFLDGGISTDYLIGTLGELILMIWGIFNLNYYKVTKPSL